MTESVRVLFVDDDWTIRKMYGNFLREEGFDVVEEESATSALCRLAGDEKFDVVVTDIMMAKMDGWDLLKEIRDGLDFDSVTLPVIVISAHFKSDTLRAEAFRRGASSTFAKGEPLSRLLKEVRIHTGTMRSRFDDDTISD